jgi:predicted nucleotidyltransferase component of viral defense system
LELLRNLSGEKALGNVRLVGGTSLALQYGHRNSVDLDFFGNIGEENDEFKEILRKYGKLSILKESKNINVYIVNGIKIDIVNYKYPWIDNVIEEDGLRLASPTDIAAMKVNAIEGRGTKKDFIDIYFLLQHFSLNDILRFYQKKYPENSIFRALMSMTYFDDADRQIMPKMFVNITWEAIKINIKEIVDHYSE